MSIFFARIADSGNGFWRIQGFLIFSEGKWVEKKKH